MQEHILLTSLGTQAKTTVYKLGENGKNPKEADLAPLALIQLLDPSQLPTQVFAMVTKGAGDTTWDVFRPGILSTLNVEPTRIEISDGRNNDEIRAILEAVAMKIPRGAELTLDVTQGFRHFPFIFYALVLYLTSLHNVKLQGAYYGMSLLSHKL